MDLSVIIVNYNTTLYIKECLDSIIRFTKDLEYEIIIVDNNSPERDIESVLNIFKLAKYFFLNSNNGFGAGCNYGASKASGKYLAFVNPDVILTSNAFFEMFKFMAGKPEVGFVSGAFTDMEGELTYTYNLFPSYSWEFAEAFTVGHKRIIRKLLNKLQAYPQIKKPFEVDWIYGACMFIKSKLFHKVNGFDESMFLYYEDVDLQYRIKELGYKVVCIPYLRMKHFTNSSVSGIEGRKLSYFQFHRSKLIYMYKHFSILKRNIIRIIHIDGILVRIITLPFSFNFRGRKYDRFCQYMQVLKLYLSGRENILNARFPISEWILPNCSI